MKNLPDVHPELPPSILYWIGDSYYFTKRVPKALEVYNEVLEKYPNFFRKLEVKRTIGNIQFDSNPNVLPEYYIEILGSSEASRDDNKYIIEDILTDFEKITDLRGKFKLAEKLLQTPNLETKNSELYGLLKYIQSSVLHKEDKFEESNALIDTYISKLKKGSYVYLRSYLLKTDSYRDLKDVDSSQRELSEFITNYTYESGISVHEEDFEDSFYYFETRAQTYEIENKFDASFKNYSFNNDLLLKSATSRLPIDKLKKDYSPYYQKRMVDSGLQFSRKVQQDNDESILSQVNLLGKKRLNVTGRVTGSLDWLFQQPILHYFKILGDFRDFQRQQYFDLSALDLVDNYYSEKIIQARENLELGTVYGYAYYLITRSSLEENFYLRENILTESRKKKILQQLKQAEYELKWLIYADPNYSDAYLLLGWLNQYIDVRKMTILPSEKNTDGNIFHSLYQDYFPGEYLKDNLDLYTQILDFQGKKASKKVLADINLNLANNYFIVNNPQKALIHYQEVDKLSRFIIDRNHFESYNQKALFLFNYARANIYNGKVEESLPLLQKSIDIYYENEYYPLVSKIGIQKEKSPYFPELEEARKKLALLHALVGLAEMELEKFSDAILSLSTSLSMNGETEFIDDISLYNSLAICYQKTGDYNKSDISLRLADKEFRKKKKGIKDIFNFSIWETVLPDKRSIIGEGRFPLAMPLEFSNLLTQGIRIRNLTDKKEFNQTTDLIENRKKFIEENDLQKKVMGEKIRDNSLNELGFNEFLRGNYFKASSIFTEDYQEKNKKGEKLEAYKSYLRSDISLYSHIEENATRVDDLITELFINIKFLNKFKYEQINSCLPNLAQKILPLEENTLIQCQKKFYEEFREYDAYLGYNYFYLGEVFRQKKDIEKSFVYYGYSLPLLKNPSGITDEGIGLSEDKFTMKERTRLRLLTAIVYHRLGEKEKFDKIIREAYYIASEFQFEKELLSIYLIQAEYAFAIAKQKKDYKTALDFISSAELILKNSPGNFLLIDEIYINNLYAIRANVFIRMNQIDELTPNREKLYSAIFFHQLLVNELKFQNYNLFETLNDLQQDVAIDNEIAAKIESMNIEKADTKYYNKAKENNYISFLKHLEEIKSYIPKGMDIHSWIGKPKVYKVPNHPTEAVIEFYSDGPDYILLTRYMGKTTVKKTIIKNDNKLNDIAKLIDISISDKPLVNKLVIISSAVMNSVDFNRLAYKGKVLNDFFEIRYLFRLSQLERENSTEFSRLRRVTSVDTFAAQKKQATGNLLFNQIENLITPAVIETDKIKELNLRIVPYNEIRNYLTDTDILEGPTDFLNRKHFIGEKKEGHLHIKEVVENEWNVPLVIINNYSRNKDNYIKAGFLYDILHFAGVQSLVLLEAGKDTEKIRNKLISNIREANKIIKEENLILIGESIHPYPEDQKVYEEEFKKYTSKAMKAERNKKYLVAMKDLLQANSVLPDDRKDLLIESELNIARLKTFLFVNKQYLIHYESLLNKFPINSNEEERIIYEMLMRCYETSIEVECTNYYNKYQSMTTASIERKYIIYFYKHLREGDLRIIEPEYKKFISIDTKEDLYIKNMKLAYLFSRGFVWDKALTHIKLALKFAETDTERLIAENRLSDIESEIYFIRGLDPAFARQDRIYYLGANRIWDKYNEKVKKFLMYETNYFKKSYQSRIYAAFGALENVVDFKPISLGPIYMKDGRPSLFLLKESDRDFLFHLLVKSISSQTADELNNQFDILLDTELKLKNRNRGLWMLIEWASSLYHRGDMNGSRIYFTQFETLFNDYYKEQNITRSYYELKFKLSKVFDDIKFEEKERIEIRQNFKEWFQFYETAENETKVENFPDLITRVIQSKKTEKLDPLNQREFYDFLKFLLAESLQKNNQQVFLEIGFYFEKIKAYNDKVLGKNPFFSDLPSPSKNIVSKLLQKISKNQTFKALIDLGVLTYLVEIKDGNIVTKKVFEDNRMIKFKILDYLFTIKDYGASEVKQETIEAIYRKAIELEKNRLTYLYLPSYHFKAQIEPEEQDYYYYVLNPELLVERPIYDQRKDLLSDYKTEIKKGKFTANWWRSLKKLEEAEITNFSGKGNGNSVLVTQEELRLINNNHLEFNGYRLQNISRQTRVGVWIHTGSLLYNTSLHNDDYVNSLVFIDKLYHGPAIVSVGSQQDTHTAYFLKTFLKKKSGQSTVFDRYLDAYTEVEYNQDEDRFWNGWKPYTNVLLNEN
jgi:hypothetical protein